MRKSILLIAFALAAAASAQTAQRPSIKLELRPFVGATLPTIDQRDLFTNAFTVGAQGAVEVRPTFHVVGTISWTPTQSKYRVADEDVNIFQYDAGLELGTVRPLSGGWELRPFLGLGGGGRTYAYASSDLTDKSCFVAYGALGTEFQLGRTAIRLEGRDNAFCYRSPIPGVDSRTRNDVGLFVGAAYRFR